MERIWPDVILTPDERRTRDEIAEARLARKYTPRFPEQDTRRNAYLGVTAEIVAARYFGLDDVPSAEADDVDLSPGWQVRSTRQPRGRLYFAEKDIDRGHGLQPFILVTPAREIFHPDLTEFCVRGWLVGVDLMQPEYWDPTLPGPCWAAPQRDLICASWLRDWHNERRA